MSDHRFTANRKPVRAGQVISYVVLTLVCLLMVLPIVLTFLYSFFPMSEMTAYLKTRNNYDAARWMDILLSPSLVSLRQYYSLLIFLISAAVMVVVSLLTAPPVQERLDGLTYGTVSSADRQKSRSSWNWVDVAGSAAVLGAILAAYLFFVG